MTTTTSSMTQPAIYGGLVMGALSALPLISAGNLCCCLWVISGGLVAAYFLQQSQTAPITQGDGALVGLMAAVCGSIVYLVISIPLALLVAPMEREVMQRLVEGNNRMPPEAREFVTRFGSGPLRLMIGFVFFLVIACIFSTLGGVIGSLIFAKKPPAGPADQTTPQPAG